MLEAVPDPLTPMDQKFATLDDLSSHYRLFINRIQQQIATIGGGGAGFIKDLDDVSFDQTTGTNGCSFTMVLNGLVLQAQHCLVLHPS